MLEISLIAQRLFLPAALAVSARVTIRTRSVARGTSCLYGLAILWIVLFAAAMPVLIAALSGVDRGEIHDAFPEATGVLPVVFVGWIPAFVWAALVLVAYVVLDEYRDRLDLRALARHLRWILWRVAARIPGGVCLVRAGMKKKVAHLRPSSLDWTDEFSRST